MKSEDSRVVVVGRLIGVMLTAIMISCTYADWRILGLPFVPFDIFDWLTRLLPGRVIAFGIDSMVRVIRTLGLGPTADASKVMEQATGGAGLFFTGAAFRCPHKFRTSMV